VDHLTFIFLLRRQPDLIRHPGPPRVAASAPRRAGRLRRAALAVGRTLVELHRDGTRQWLRFEHPGHASIQSFD
jgi:hypothetical protein